MKTIARLAILMCVALCVMNVQAGPAIDDASLENYLEARDYWRVRLSPDGRHVSLIMRKDGRNTLVVLDLETMKPTASVRYEESADIEVSGAEWINNELLYYNVVRKVARLETDLLYPELFVLAANGRKNARVWNTYGNYEDNERRRGELIRGYPSVVNVLPRDEHRVLVFVSSFERRDGAALGKLVELDVRNGNTSLVDETPEYTQRILSGRDGKQLLSVGTDRQYETRLHLSENGGKSWRPVRFAQDGYVGRVTAQAVENGFVYVLAQREERIDAPSHLMRYDIAEDRWERVYDIGFSNLTGIDIGEAGQAVRIHWVDRKPEFRVLDADDRASRVLSSFARSFPGMELRIVSETEDGSKLLLHVGSGAHMGEYFLYDATARQARFLIAMDEDFDASMFADLQPAHFEASDGVTIPGWFLAPKGVTNPPLVVDIHGGPHGPYHPYDFNAYWHLFNAMGYAVYAPNFRGSGGYGEGFERAGFGQWGTRMLDDVADGARHLAERGLVDPGRICVYGGSYGGYGSAQSLVRHNDLYRCGIIIAGIFDLETQKDRTDTRQWYAGGNYMDAAIGDDGTQLKAMSPIHNIERIRAPMLILHGTEDERTPFKGAEEFVEALKKAGKDFEYHWYPKEGHGNVKLGNRIDEWRRIEAFLARANRAPD